MRDAIAIVPRVLKEQVEAGWKLKPLAEHYGLAVNQMKAALKAQGLAIRKFHAPKFFFVNDINEELVQEINNNFIDIEESDDSIEVADSTTEEHENNALPKMQDW